MTPARIWKTWRERMVRLRMSIEERAREEAVLVAAYRETFSGERGRLVLADILQRGGIVQRGYAPGEPGDLMFFREGRRSLALEIVEMINRDPQAALEMVRTGEVADLLEKHG